MTSEARFVIDARYVEPKPSGIGRYVEALIERLGTVKSWHALLAEPAAERP